MSAAPVAQPAAEGRRGRQQRGGGRMEALLRTAGIAGVLGAAFIQVLQHARPR